MYSHIKAVTLFAIVVCAGCAETPDKTLTLSVDSVDPSVIEHTRAVLQQRFIDLKPAYFSKVESKVTDSSLIFTFKNGGPSPATLEFLYKSPGKFQAVLLPGTVEVMTNQDIAYVEPYYRDSRRMLYFKLTEQAGKRMAAMSAQNTGKEFQIRVDGQVILDTRIDGSFSDAFKADSSRMDYLNVEALEAVLKYGELPTRVSIADAN